MTKSSCGPSVRSAQSKQAPMVTFFRTRWRAWSEVRTFPACENAKTSRLVYTSCMLEAAAATSYCIALAVHPDRQGSPAHQRRSHAQNPPPVREALRTRWYTARHNLRRRDCRRSAHASWQRRALHLRAAFSMPSSEQRAGAIWRRAKSMHGGWPRSTQRTRRGWSNATLRLRAVN